MSGSSHALASLATAASLGVGFLLAAPILGSSSASALPPASGSKCNANWVNNQEAMGCFIKGEEESRSGVKHPHYVACTAAGEVFCCVDNDAGAQNCDAMLGGRPSSQADWTRAVLAAHRSMTTSLGRYADTPYPPRSRLPEAVRKGPP